MNVRSYRSTHPRLVADPVGRDELRVHAEPGAVPLVRRQALEAEQRLGAVAGALGGQEVAVVHAAVPGHQRHPGAGEPFERLDPGGSMV